MRDVAGRRTVEDERRVGKSDVRASSDDCSINVSPRVARLGETIRRTR